MGISKVMLGDEVKLDLTGDSVIASALLKGYTAHGKDGEPVEGEIPIKQAVMRTINHKQLSIYIDPGYYSQQGVVAIDSMEAQKITPGNIKSGVKILGITGSYGGESVKVQAVKYATPGFAAQVITPDTGYDYLASVEVAGISLQEEENDAGGITLYIG